MKLSYKLVIAAFFVTVIGSFIWSANHYYSKYQYEKKRADEAERNAGSATAITNNVLQSLQIVNTVLEAIRRFCFLVSGEEQNVVVVIIVVHPVAAAGDWLHVITSWWKRLKRTAAGHAIFWRGNCVNH